MKKLVPTEMVKIIRLTFIITLIITIIQKLLDPQQYENLSKLISLMQFSFLGKYLLDSEYVYWFLLCWEFIIVLGLSTKSFFIPSLLMGFIMITLGIVSSLFSLYFGLKSNCGCGLFGENPYVILFQKLLLFVFLSILWKYRNQIE